MLLTFMVPFHGRIDLENRVIDLTTIKAPRTQEQFHDNTNPYISALDIITIKASIIEAPSKTLEHQLDEADLEAQTQDLKIINASPESPEHQDDKIEPETQTLDLATIKAPPESPKHQKELSQKKRDESPCTDDDDDDPSASITSSYYSTLPEAALHPAKFCTQKCLLGLETKSALDLSCPNAIVHRQNSSWSNHLISLQETHTLLQQQLAKNQDEGCTPLTLGTEAGKLHPGDKHMIFRITLTSHGYSFIGKGTQSRSSYRLLAELNVHKALKHLQGRKIPVFLGEIYPQPAWQVKDPDHENSEMEIVHMLLMSYGGKGISLEQMERYRDEINWLKGAGYKMRESNRCRRNILWSEELCGLVFVDFERAEPGKNIVSR